MTSQLTDVAQAKARSHPIRLAVLRSLALGRVASPTELSKELGLDLPLVSYHVRKLAEFDCIELVETKPRRGAVEHYYRALSPPFYSDETWAELSDGERAAATHEVLVVMANDIAAASASGTIDSREDRHVTHSPFQLDERGWSEVAEEVEALRQRVNELAGESVNRIARGESEGEPIPARLLLLFFEAAPGDG